MLHEGNKELPQKRQRWIVREKRRPHEKNSEQVRRLNNQTPQTVGGEGGVPQAMAGR